jgi:drug/metabolite transporter (DMT)-like permease
MKAIDMLTLVALAAVWGGSFVLIRVAVPFFGPATLVVVRVAIAAVLLGIFAVATGRRLELRPYAGRLVVLGLINAALPYVLISAAELRLTASFAALLNSTVPLFASGFAVVWLGERLTTARWLGLLAGLAGVAIMVGWSPAPLSVGTALGVAAMLTGSASYALSGIYTKLRLRGVPVYTLALGQQLGALPWLIAPSIVLAPRTVPPAGALLAVVALGVLCTAFAYVLYFRLIDRVGPTKTSTVTYLLPVFGVLWGGVFLGEPVTVGMLAGFVFVLCSVVLVNEVRLPRFRATGRARILRPWAERAGARRNGWS